MRESKLKFVQHFEAWDVYPERRLELDCGAEDLDSIIEEFGFFLKGCGFEADQVEAALSPVEAEDSEVKRVKKICGQAIHTLSSDLFELYKDEPVSTRCLNDYLLRVEKEIKNED